MSIAETVPRVRIPFAPPYYSEITQLAVSAAFDLSIEALIWRTKWRSDPTEKLKWLEVVENLLKPDSGIGSLLSMELGATRRAVDKSN
jgi:hypothetical protein